MRKRADRAKLCDCLPHARVELLETRILYSADVLPGIFVDTNSDLTDASTPQGDERLPDILTPLTIQNSTNTDLAIQPNELIVVSRQLADHVRLAHQVAATLQQPETARILYLSESDNGIERIATALRENEFFDSLHLIASEPEIVLGRVNLDLSAILRHESLLNQWSAGGLHDQGLTIHHSNDANIDSTLENMIESAVGVQLRFENLQQTNAAAPITQPDNPPGAIDTSDGQTQTEDAATEVETGDSRQLVFIDTATPDYQRMLSDLTTARTGVELEVILIDQASDGLQLITRTLEQAGTVDAVHIISHGTDAQITLGSAVLNQDTMQLRSSEIGGWAEHMSPDADILVYGCNFAQHQSGQDFIQAFAELCQCDVAASDDLTGHENLDGNWTLEYRIGPIETDIAFSESFQQYWLNSLDITSNLVAHYEFEEGIGTTSSDSSINNNAGSLSNSGIWSTDAAVGNYALDFSGDTGANYRFTVPDNTALEFGTGDFTISFWMKSNTVPAFTTNVVSQTTGGLDGFSFNTDEYADINLEARHAFVNVEDVHDNDWHLITGVRSANTLSLYYDGVLKDSGSLTGQVSSHVDFTVGATGANTDDFEGLIDDVRIYSRALSGADISELAAPPNTAPVITMLDNNPVFTEDGSAVLIDGDVQVADAELDALNGGLGNYNGALFYIARNGTENTDDVFTLAEINGLSVVDSLLYYNGKVVASLDQADGHISASFTDTFGEIPTTSLVNDFIRQINYSNTSHNPPGSVELLLLVLDGNTGSQGAGSSGIAGSTITVSITPQNDAPSLDNTGDPSLTVVFENSTDNTGTSVAQLIHSAGSDIITDPDASSAEGIALVAVDNTNGIWQYSVDSGVTWITTDPDVSNAVLLDENSLIRFEPDTGYTGTAAIAFKAWDQSAGTAGSLVSATPGGGTSAFSTAAETATILVQPMSLLSIDAPVSMEVDEDNALVFGGADALQVSDGTTGNARLRVSVSVFDGQLQLAGNTGLTMIEGSAGASKIVFEGLESDINNALQGLQYIPSPDYHGIDSLQMSVEVAGTEAHFPFDVSAEDKSTGANYDGTLRGSAAIVPDAERGNVLALNGVSGTDVKIEEGFSGFDGLTASVWVDADSGYSEVISIGDGSFSIRVDDPYTSGNVSAFFYNGSQFFHATSTDAIAGTGWRHLAATLDNVTGELVLYIDGVAVSQVTGTGSALLAGDTYIGSNNGASLFLNGRVDDVQLFNRVLDAESVALLATDSAHVKNTVAINVDPVNDSPVVSGVEPSALLYAENSGAALLASSLSISDIDHTHLHGATVRITTGFVPGEDTLSYSPVFGITGDWNAGNGTLSLNGTATLTQYQSLLRSVTYENSSEDPTENTRNISISVNDGVSESNVADRTLLVSGENDAPELSSVETIEVYYVEGDGAVPVSSQITVSDVDDSMLESAVVRVTPDSYFDDEDELSFTDTATITGNWDVSTGVLTLTGVDTVANYQSALRAVTYENISEDVSDALIGVSFEVYDAAERSDLVTREIDLYSVNDIPVVSEIETGTILYTENAVPAAISETIEITDVDNSYLESATVRISNNYVASEDRLYFNETPDISTVWDNTSGTLTLIGDDTIENYQKAIREIRYQNSSDDPDTSVREISLFVSDFDSDSLTVSRSLLIDSVNDPPVVASIEAQSLNYNSDSGAVTVSEALTISDIDDTLLEFAVVSISSGYLIDQERLTFTDTADISGVWDATLGTLTLTGVDTVAGYQRALRNIQYENTQFPPTAGSRVVTFTVSDGDFNAAVVQREINVIYDNIAPELNLVDSAAMIYRENDQPLTVSQDLSVTDETIIESARVWFGNNYFPAEDVLIHAESATISGVWDQSTGILTFSGADTASAYQALLRTVQYQNVSDDPAVVDRQINISVTDSELSSNTITRLIQVVTVNDPPQAEDNRLSLPEDSIYTFSVPDFGFADPVDNNELHSIVIGKLPHKGVLKLNGTDIATGQTVEVSALNAGQFSYHPEADDFGLAYTSFEFKVRDNAGVESTGADLSVTSNTIILDVSSVNDLPVIVSQVLTLDEGAQALIDPSVLSGFDADVLQPAELVFSVTNGPANGEFRLSGVSLQAGETFTLSDIMAGLVSYRHNGSETDSDQVVLSLADNIDNPGAAAVGTLSLVINEVLDSAPEVNDESFTIAFAGSFDSSAVDALDSGRMALGGDHGADPTMTIQIERLPEHGVLELLGDNTFSYQHDGSWHLSDDFTYRVINVDGISTIATVQITIEPPVAALNTSIVEEYVVSEPESNVSSAREQSAEAQEEEEPAVQEVAPDPQESPTASSFIAFGISPFDQHREPEQTENTETRVVPVVTLDTPHTLDDLVNVVREEPGVEWHQKVADPSLVSSISPVIAQALELEITWEDKTVGISNPIFLQGLLNLESSLKQAESESDRRIKLTNEAFLGVSFSATAGIVAWLLRGGTLFASMMAFTPLWSGVDPINLLNKRAEQKKTEDVEEIFESR